MCMWVRGEGWIEKGHFQFLDNGYVQWSDENKMLWGIFSWKTSVPLSVIRASHQRLPAALQATTSQLYYKSLSSYTTVALTHRADRFALAFPLRGMTIQTRVSNWSQRKPAENGQGVIARKVKLMYSSWNNLHKIYQRRRKCSVCIWTWKNNWKNRGGLQGCWNCQQGRLPPHHLLPTAHRSFAFC